MRYYVVSGGVNKRNVNEERLRQALFKEEQVYVFTDKKEAAAFAADDIGPRARNNYAVYEVEIEFGTSTSDPVTEEITLKNGKTINASIISPSSTAKFQAVSATLNDQTYFLIPNTKIYYVVNGHFEGNLDEKTLLRFFNQNYKNKDITAFNTIEDAANWVKKLNSALESATFPIFEIWEESSENVTTYLLDWNNEYDINLQDVKKFTVVSAIINGKREYLNNASYPPKEAKDNTCVQAPLVDQQQVLTDPVDLPSAQAAPLLPVLVEPVPVQTNPVEPAPVQINPVDPTSSVQTNPAEPTPVQTDPVEPIPAQTNPVEPIPPVQSNPTPIRQTPQAQSFLNQYWNKLLVACAYLTTTAVVLASKIIPTLATAAVANGYAVPAALTASTSLPIVAAAFGLSAVGFGSVYVGTKAAKSIYAYVKSAWDRCNMSDRQRYDADLRVGREQLARLEDSLANKSDADNDFIAKLHQCENNAPEATFDAQGRAIRAATTTPNKAVVLQFEIQVMRRLNQTNPNVRSIIEYAMLREANRRNFTPAASN